MKKVILFVLIMLLNISMVSASDKKEVTFSKCVDGDTAYFIMDNKEIKTRFLAIDTPESTNEIEPYGKEASDFTCNKLKSAKKIELEFDPNSDLKDKYDRYLVWVFLDDYLLQDLIIKEGLGEVAYLYGNYTYTDILKDHQEIAKANKLNMWGDYKEEDKTIYYVVGGALFIIMIIFSKKYRNKVIRKLKKEVSNGL